ncbi:hypothetical protein, partial [Bacillus thuringiensis]|uniref:hypothetical protein n=1 Tax=Bacillus thuringiensis TaxID=1428 RepID=UPI0011A63684
VVYVVIIAGLISGFVGEWGDGSIMGVVVVLNGVMGVVEEWKAEEGLEGLKKMGRGKGMVKRNGEVKEIGCEEVVGGDMVMV